MVPVPNLLIIECGKTTSEIEAEFGGFPEHIMKAAEISAATVIAPYNSEKLPSPGTYQGIILTGAHALVTDREPWSVRLESWIHEALKQKVPLLGICYGHQLLAQATGGRVITRERGPCAGTFELSVQPEAMADSLFSAQLPKFAAQLTHSQEVTDLPPEATLLCTGPNHNVQAFRLGSNAWGIQFHPEFTPDITQAYIALMTEALEASGQKPQALSDNVQPTPYSTRILTCFVRHISEHTE